jgi:mRNA interferase MazF
MVKQGDIIKFDFDPVIGHEQGGYRPAIVVSNSFMHQTTGIVVVCPITNTVKDYPVRVRLTDEDCVTGVVMCDQIKSVDLSERSYRLVGRATTWLMDRVLHVISLELKREG